ncbi:TPA: hypothetical protein EYP37_05440 [Candidatus Poribacteria bacterium]|nr:hypothetical protein [Candidatus Poribacteria bacterium]
MKFIVWLLVLALLPILGCGWGDETKEEPKNFDIFYYSQTDFTIESVEEAERAWLSMEKYPEIDYVATERSYVAILFMHPFSLGPFDPAAAEWIGIVTSIPQADEPVKAAIIRLDYRSMELKKGYKMLLSSAPLISVAEAARIMEENPQYVGMIGWRVDESRIDEFGGNYIYSYPASDLGGVMVVNGYASKVIFSATSIWNGVGKVLIPGGD